MIEHDGQTSAPGGAVVFWDAAAEAAIAYSRTVDGGELTFSVVEGQIVDAETGSVWRVDGVASEGPLAGNALEPIRESYNAFWFAWAAFERATSIWEASGHGLGPGRLEVTGQNRCTDACCRRRSA